MYVTQLAKGGNLQSLQPSQSQSLTGSLAGSQLLSGLQYDIAAEEEETQGHHSNAPEDNEEDEEDYEEEGDALDVSYTLNELTGEQEVVLTSQDAEVSKMVRGVLSRVVQVSSP